MPETPATCTLHGLGGCALCLPADDALPLRIPGGSGYAAGGYMGDLYYRVVPPFSGNWVFYPAGTEFVVDAVQLQEAERQRAEEYARARAEEEAARAAAREKAEQLLLRWLSPAQQRDYRERHRFDVTGSDGRRWRILCSGQTGNVQQVGENGEGLMYCAHPRGLPDPAAWLTQAMAIAHDAAGFIRTANFYGIRPAEEPAAGADPPAGGGSRYEGLGAMLRRQHLVARYLARGLPPV